MKRSPKLVTSWWKSLRFWTQRLSALFTLFSGAAAQYWSTLPDESKKEFLESHNLPSALWLVPLGFAAIFVVRNIKQPGGDPPRE